MGAVLKLNYSDSTLKYLLFSFNLVFLLCGLVALGLSAFLLATEAVTVSGLDYSLGLCLSVALVTLAIALMGCLGAIRESNCLLVTFAVSLAAVILCQMVTFGLLVGKADLAAAAVQTLFEQAKAGDASCRRTVASIQTHFACCGFADPSFWVSAGADGAAWDGLLPAACCADPLASRCTLDGSYHAGCSSAFVEFVRQYGVAFGSVGIVIAVAEVLGVWFSLALAARIRELGRRGKHF